MRANFETNRGFTLLEALVSIVILTLIITVVLTDRSTYTDQIALTNDLEELSLRIYQSQIYGIGVKEVNPGSSEFASAYGVTFSCGDCGGNNNYIVWVDRNGNGIYDSGWACPTGGASECIERVYFTNGNIKAAICYINSGYSKVCEPNLNGFLIRFPRPGPGAQFTFYDGFAIRTPQPNHIGATVTLRSPKGVEKTMRVFVTGNSYIE